MLKKGRNVIIHVNGKRIPVQSQRVSYDKVVELSGLPVPEEHEFVLYFDAISDPRTGLLSKGHDVIASRDFPTRFQVV